ncbi:hypothetical protein Tco_1264526 [Tanacetum coccineum]
MASESASASTATGVGLTISSNTTLRNHITHPHCEAKKAQQNQNPEAGQTSMARDGSVFRYDPDYLREQFAGLVIQRALPFNHFDHEQTTRVFQNTMQPRYTHVSCSTLKRDAMKLWLAAKQEIIDSFGNINACVNLTTDVWSSSSWGGYGFIHVVTQQAHWMNPYLANDEAVISLRRVSVFLTRDHLDAKERKQDKSPLEIPLDFKEDVLDDEIFSPLCTQFSLIKNLSDKTLPVVSPYVGLSSGMPFAGTFSDWEAVNKGPLRRRPNRAPGWVEGGGVAGEGWNRQAGGRPGEGYGKSWGEWRVGVERLWGTCTSDGRRLVDGGNRRRPPISGWVLSSGDLRKYGVGSRTGSLRGTSREWAEEVWVGLCRGVRAVGDPGWGKQRRGTGARSGGTVGCHPTADADQGGLGPLQALVAASAWVVRDGGGANTLLRPLSHLQRFGSSAM